MFTELKTEVCRVNKAFVDSGLVILTWGNVSGVDRVSVAPAIPKGLQSFSPALAQSAYAGSASTINHQP